MNEADTFIERFMAIRKISSKLMKQIRKKLEDINITGYVIMKNIAREKQDMIMSELSELTGFSNTLITFSIDVLEKKGYVYRKKGEDRRTYYVKLTDNGNKILETLKKEVNKEIDKIFEKMTQADFERFSMLMSELNDLLKKYIGES